jgi:hypothetical protein
LVEYMVQIALSTEYNRTDHSKRHKSAICPHVVMSDGH